MTDSQRSRSGKKTQQLRRDRALEERRLDMQSAEGHAGSVPRGNPEREDDTAGQRRDELERLLGH